MPKILALSGGAAAAGTVTAPVALTANTIPKATGAATLANSSITDNGTTVATTEIVDLSGAPSMKVPVGAGLQPTVSGQVAYDSTANRFGGGANGSYTLFGVGTAHNISVPLQGSAASASGTTYTCTTSPTFVPADGDMILFEADVANTGAATLNVNASGAAPIKKQGGGTALVANDLLAGQDVLMIFDGVNWQMQGQIGNAASTGTVTATGGALTANSVVLGAGTTDTKVLAGFTTDGLTELDVGPADAANNGILGLKGKTSGTAKFTAPAVAGTATNPVAMSNILNGPAGAAATPTYSFTGGATSGIYARTLGAVSFSASSALIMSLEGNSLVFNGATTNSVAWGATNVNDADTFIGRQGIGALRIGAAAGGNTGNLQLGKITSYSAIATVDGGVPSEVGHLDLVTQSAAITATTIYTPTATGRYRISVYEKVTTAASVSSVLGGATGTVLTFTDGTDSVAQSITMGLDNQGGTLALTNNGNSTTTSLNGSAYIYAKTGVAIQIAVGYTSVNAGEMVFALRATCEAL